MTRPINPPLPEDPAYREQLKRVIALGRKKHATPGGRVRNFRAKLDQMFKEHAESVLEGSYADVTGRVNPRAVRPHLTDIRGSDTPPGKMSPHSRVPIQRPPQLGRQRGGMTPKVPYRNPLVPKLREELSLEYIDWVIESALSNAGGKSWGPKTGGSSGGVTISNANGKVGASIGGVGGNLSGAVGGGFGSKGTASGRFSGASATGRPTPKAGSTAVGKIGGGAGSWSKGGMRGGTGTPQQATPTQARHVGGPPMGSPSGGGAAMGAGNRGAGGGQAGNVTGNMPRGSVTPKSQVGGGTNPRLSNSPKAPAGNVTGTTPQGSKGPQNTAGAAGGGDRVKGSYDATGTPMAGSGKPIKSFGAGGTSKNVYSHGQADTLNRLGDQRRAKQTAHDDAVNNIKTNPEARAASSNILGSRSSGSGRGSSGKYGDWSNSMGTGTQRKISSGGGGGYSGSSRTTSFGASVGGSFAGGRGNIRAGFGASSSSYSARGGGMSQRGSRSGWGGW